MIRLFVALKIPPDIIEKLLTSCYAAAENAMRFRWETKEKIHLTLKFIGEVKESLLEPLSQELDFVENYSVFDSKITRFGFFYRYKDPKILWCDLKSHPPFSPLVSELNSRLERYGIEAERREFRAHLTLLRIKQRVSEGFVNTIKSCKFEEINFIADKIALVKSELSQQGARYTDLKTFELKGRRNNAN